MVRDNEEMAKFLLNEELGRLHTLSKDELLLVKELKELLAQEEITPDKLEEIRGIIEELKDKIDEGIILTEGNIFK